ncbi:hypothetical protein ACFXEL_03905 [Streptomyces sp. NPDC059382]|uniref:hypothetical protein n=1 Tax=Streptomyces sp. NPDC059382 TaxID=3346816 RepID=UPI0036BFF494
MVDWEQLARIPADDRVNVLGDAACPDFCPDFCCEACEDADHALTGGWVWRRQVSWCAEYRFHGTTGSYGWRPRVLLLSAPDEVSELVRSWQVAAPRLEELRGPFEAEAAGWAGRPAGYDAAAALLREWGDVTTEAGARGWGLLGLPF